MLDVAGGARLFQRDFGSLLCDPSLTVRGKSTVLRTDTIFRFRAMIRQTVKMTRFATQRVRATEKKANSAYDLFVFSIVTNDSTRFFMVCTLRDHTNDAIKCSKLQQ